MAADPLDLSGLVALVTGAGSGIGRACAHLFARKGARVGLLDLDVAETWEAFQAEGLESEPLVADVSDPAQVEAAVERLTARYGRLDIVHANAGINGVWAPIEQLTAEEWDRTLGVNLKGSFLTIKYAVPHLKRQGGSILLTSSINGTRCFSNSGATAYSASKAAQVAMAKALAVELGPSGIRVNVLCPGAIETSIHANTQIRDTGSIRWPAHYPRGTSPLVGSSAGSPEQVADVALFLVSRMASHLTGEVMYVDAGTSLIVG
jgi:NAD(P)-dependent dehydrogenase (short-subunit alcohol dehydrogenase family)